MDPDRRSAVLTGTFFILGTVLGLAGLGVALVGTALATVNSPAGAGGTS